MVNNSSVCSPAAVCSSVISSTTATQISAPSSHLRTFALEQVSDHDPAQSGLANSTVCDHDPESHPIHYSDSSVHLTRTSARGNCLSRPRTAASLSNTRNNLDLRAPKLAGLRNMGAHMAGYEQRGPVWTADGRFSVRSKMMMGRCLILKARS